MIESHCAKIVKFRFRSKLSSVDEDNLNIISGDEC
jgi:hypothetical protein